MTYTVTNIYGIAGESRHRTPEAALKAAGNRDGAGWTVEDQDGNQWDSNGNHAVIVRRGDETNQINTNHEAEGGTMNEYKITLASAGTELAIVEAENAAAALESYCANTPDEDTGFARGGLNCDADTRGNEWANIRTDGGRINADKVE